MTKSDCQAANWENVGRFDGQQGEPAQEIDRIQAQCEVHDQLPNRQAYMAGYQDGVSKYCTEKNGEILGRQGSQYFEDCPENQKSAFLRGYRYGLSQFKVQMNRDRIEAYQSAVEAENKQKSIQ